MKELKSIFFQVNHPLHFEGAHVLYTGSAIIGDSSQQHKLLNE